MAQFSFRRIRYTGCCSATSVCPVRRHHAGMSARAPESRALSCSMHPGGNASSRSRSSSTRSPQPRSPASHSALMSHPQVARLDLFVAQELVRAGLVDDLALAHEIDVVGDAEGEGEVLLHEQDGGPPGLEPAQDASELSHQERREPLRGLVHQENVGVAHQRPPAGEHLLLAAGELVAAVPEALAQPREEPEHPIEAPAGAVAGALADLEMLADTERREDAPALRDQPHAPAGDLVRSKMRDVLAAQEDAPSPRRREADDGADQSRLAHTVATEHGNDLPLAQAQGESLQDVALDRKSTRL